MASLLRSVSSHFGSSGKPSDVQLAQSIEQFNAEREKLHRFKREFNKFLDAIVIFDNATFRFYEAMQALDKSNWKESSSLEQVVMDVRSTRNERLQTLKNETNKRLNVTTVKFDSMRDRINLQTNTEQDYKRVSRQHDVSMRGDSAVKTDRLRNDLNQLKSSLRDINKNLNRDLPDLQKEVRNDYADIILDVLDTEGKFYKKYYKTCSRFVKRTKKKLKTPSNAESEDTNLSEGAVLNSQNNGQHTQLQNDRATSSKRPKFTILYNVEVKKAYQAVNPDELNLVQGEILQVIELHQQNADEKDEGWEHARNEDGTIGLIPMNFVACLYSNTEPTEPDAY